MNSETNSAVKLFPAWKELYEQAKSWEYGSFHSHEEIMEILEHHGPRTIRYYGALRRAGRELEESNQKCLVNVTDKGYRVIQPREHVKEGSRRVGQAHRRMKRAFAVVKNTDTAQLNNLERRLHTDTLARTGTALALTADTQRSVRRLAAGLPAVQRDIPRRALPAPGKE